MKKNAFASSDDWSEARALEFLVSIANKEVDAAGMRASIPDFLLAAGATRAFRPSPVLGLTFRGLNEDALLSIRDELYALLRMIGPDASDAEGMIQLQGMQFFSAGPHGLLVAGPLRTLLCLQAIRLLNGQPKLSKCPASLPHDPKARCDRWLVAVASRRGPRRRFCSDGCRARTWASNHCTRCGRELNKNSRCDNCRKPRHRRQTRAATLPMS